MTERAERPIDYGRYDEGRYLNYWALDPVVRFEVRRTYGDDEYEWAESRLSEFGATVGHTIADNSDVIDGHGPELHTYDKDGEMANEVEYHPAQFENERLAYGAGIVADSFRPPPGREEPMPLLHNLAMEYLLCYADGGLTCPVAMTAGAALVLEKFGGVDAPARAGSTTADTDDASDTPDDDPILQDYFDRLTTRDHDDLVEGAMFLTEKQGGSDVGANETVAERADDGTWRLTGEKWFCSNIDAEGTLVLARRPDAPDGTEGLSLFLVPHTKRDGSLNDQLYRRLKDKLGTISVPTGEVELRGAEGYLVGETEAGFREMTEMLNLERLSNAMASVGIVGRALLEAKVHAANREAFGRTIDEFPLMREDLVDMAVDHEAATAFTFEAAKQFSTREERERAAARGDGPGDDATAEDAFRLMRVLVPIAKARTGRLAVDTASYAMEVLGGNGYVDDFVTHRLLRDAQVLPIWEGTTNVLSLDFLRALDREDAHEPLLSEIDRRLDAAEHPYLADVADDVREEYNDLATAMATLAGEDGEYAQLSAKRLTNYVYDVFTAALLVEEAQQRIDEAGDARKALVARRFADRHLVDSEARAITSGDRFPVEQFDAVVRFASVDPATLADERAVEADD